MCGGLSACTIHERSLGAPASSAALRTFSAEQLLVLLRDHGNDIAVAAERWLLEALVTWAAAQDGRRHSAGLGPQRSVSGGGGEAPGSPSSWHRAVDSPRSQDGGSSVRGGSPWRDGSGGATGGSLRGDEDLCEQPGSQPVGLNRAAHVGAVAAPLLEHVRWDLLPDAPTGVLALREHQFAAAAQHGLHRSSAMVTVHDSKRALPSQMEARTCCRARRGRWWMRGVVRGRPGGPRRLRCPACPRFAR